MRKFNSENITFLCNGIFALALIIEYLIPFIEPKHLGFGSALTLITPVFMIINALFVLYWFFKLHRKALLSICVLLLGFGYWKHLLISNSTVEINDSFKILSYNIRYANTNQWQKNRKNVKDSITAFIKNKNPDVVCLQEYPSYEENNLGLAQEYPYHFKLQMGVRGTVATFSKYPILSRGKLHFKSSTNGSIFADLLIERDTIRIYNIHFQSFGIKKMGDVKINIDKIRGGFVAQNQQVKKIIAHEQQTKLKTIFVGDFNNTQFSWLYHQLKKGKTDCFRGMGEGTGATYRLPIPLLRIDFILADERLKDTYYKKYEVDYSDHYPIMAWIEKKQK